MLKNRVPWNGLELGGGKKKRTHQSWYPSIVLFIKKVNILRKAEDQCMIALSLVHAKQKKRARVSHSGKYIEKC